MCESIYLSGERVRVEPEPALEAGERAQLGRQRRGEAILVGLEFRGQRRHTPDFGGQRRGEPVRVEQARRLDGAQRADLRWHGPRVSNKARSFFQISREVSMRFKRDFQRSFNTCFE